MSQTSTTGVEVIHTNARVQDIASWILNWIFPIIAVGVSIPFLPIIILVTDYSKKHADNEETARSIYSTKLKFHDRYMWLGRWVVAAVMVAVLLAGPVVIVGFVLGIAVGLGEGAGTWAIVVFILGFIVAVYALASWVNRKDQSVEDAKS